MKSFDDHKDNSGLEVKRSWRKFYWLPSGSPQKIAQNGSLMVLGSGIANLIMRGIVSANNSKAIFIVGAILSIFIGAISFYGFFLVLAALVVWIKNKVQKMK